jgi:phosphonoacetaldehyde hydrolase
MWTIAVTATGNEIALSREEWEALPSDLRFEREQDAARRLTKAGAHFTAPTLADCGSLLVAIERRLAAGEKPLVF